MAKHFSLRQCIYSKLATDKNIDNTPGVDVDSNPILTHEYVKGNINNLMKHCVNPIVDQFSDVVISSVYRSKRLNEAIKPPGAKDSQHIYGMAADLISIKNYESYQIFNWAVLNLAEWDQMIWEFPEKGSGLRGSWIHISYKEGNNRKKTTIATKIKGLHDKYGNPPKRNNGSYRTYQHEIPKANPNWLNEFV
jgi:hypothetical protein